MSHGKWALVAMFLLAGPSLAQKEKKKGPAPNEVEIRLADGSRVRMTILQESVDIITKYGKLTTPTKDIRRVEFGIRPPEELAKKIDNAIKRLGNEAFKDRESAMNELVAVGAPAYIALYKAAKSTDLEVSQRAKAALAKIREKVPEDRLRVKEDDMVQTADFTIVGRISTPTIKASSGIFGETQLNVSDLRGIRWMGNNAEVELSIDAAKYAISGTQWLDTGVELASEDEISVTASGQVDLMTNGGGQYITGPAGNGQWGQGVGGHPPGALLGKIGDNGAIFLIGDKYKGSSKKEGKLMLMISPSPWARHGGNPVSGSYKVNITGGHDVND